MSKVEVTDIPGLIKELGGLTAASKFFGEAPQTVGNWRMRDQIPARLYLQHSAALKKRGIVAPPSLWAFEQQVSGAA